MKQRANFTIEENVLLWLKEKGNQSEFIESLLVSAKEAEGKYKTFLEENDRRMAELQEKSNEVIKVLHRQIEEGNKKEREEAQALLDKIEAKKQAKIANLMELKAKIEPFLNEFTVLECTDMEGIIKFACKLKDQHSIGFERRGAMGTELWPLGGFELKQLLYYLKTGEVQ